jgi:hypothetical protein
MEIMNTRLVKIDWYESKDLTGLAKKCDWFINGTQLIKLNNNEPKTIFLTGYRRGGDGVKYLVNDLLPNITTKFVLIIASEDYTFPTGKGDVRHYEYKNCEVFIKILLESPMVSHIFVENLDMLHDKMTPIPLGLLSNTNINYPDFCNIDYTKTNLCLVRHRTRDGEGQWKKRSIVDKLCKNEWASFVKFIDQEISHTAFINELKKSKFCLCIQGGGYDPCPRFFESILHGVIPIVQHSPLDDMLKKYPVVFFDDLNPETLSKDFLNIKYEELKEFYEGDKHKEVLLLLTMDYWWDLIINKI